MLILIWAVAASFWALLVTLMLVRNPLPLPDRGHRAYGVASEDARSVVLQLFRDLGFPERFTFDAGPTRQTLLSDGFTVLNHLRPGDSILPSLPANAISIAVSDPKAAAEKAASFLNASSYTAEIHEVVDVELPPNRLMVVESNAFDNWVLVFRRHIFRMPRVKRYKISK